MSDKKWTALPRKTLEPLAGFFEAEPGATIEGRYEGFFETENGAIHKIRVNAPTTITNKESLETVEAGKLVGVSEKATFKGLRDVAPGTHDVRLTYQGKKDIGKGRMAWDVEVLLAPIETAQTNIPF